LEGTLRILPHQLGAIGNETAAGSHIKGGSDGFFAAQLKIE